MIVAVGDMVCGTRRPAETPCKYLETSNLAVAQDADEKLAAVLPLGDLQYEFGLLEDFFSFYDPSWGRLKSISHPVAGNHEYETGTASGYFDYWNGRNAASGPAGPRGLGYYSYDIGTWHLIALNSNCPFVGGCNAGSPQERWLKADLAASSKPCTLAYWHHPRFSSGPSGSAAVYAPFWSALYEAGADVVVVAHDHLYERFAPQGPNGQLDERRGLRQFTVGTGGRNLYTFTSVQPNSQVRFRDEFGVLFLRLGANGYRWIFTTIPGGANFTDFGSGECH
jgi:calcineurin-like phosphoesterase family protein